MANKLTQAKKPGRRAAAPSAPPPPNDRAVIGNNREAVEAAEAAQLLSFTSRLREQQKKTAEAKAIFDGEKANETEIFNLAKAAGFLRKELQELLDDSAVSGQRRKLAESEARRARFRKIMGLPVAGHEEQAELLPDEVRDEMDWEADGYRAGIRAENPKPPAECSPRFHTAWMKGYHNGQSRNADAMKTLETIMAPPAPEPEPEPEKSAADIRRAEKAEERRAKEALDAIREVEPELVAQVEEDHGGDTPAADAVAPGYTVTGPDEESGLYTATAPGGLVVGDHFTSENAAWSAAGFHRDAGTHEAEAV